MECEDWDTGEAVTLKLDPMKTAVEVHEAVFSKRTNDRNFQQVDVFRCDEGSVTLFTWCCTISPYQVF